MLSASSINGTNVKNNQDQSLGDIKDLMIDTSNGKDLDANGITLGANFKF